MARTRKLVVDILADASKFGAELNKADGYSKKLQGRLKSLGKSMGAGLAAAGAGAAAFGVSALKAAEEADQVQRRVAQIIKATGGAANVSAKELEKFADVQQRRVGIDDEVLKKSYGILLTFKNVRNEAGKGNDIFNRTAKSLADLAAAGFGNTDSAAKAMGKALQDPIKGITALSRAGVTFTQEQKAQIKTLVEQGDLLGAQKIILAEVEGQVGGTAAAGVTGSEKMKIAFADLKEQIGTLLLPQFKKLSKWVTEKLVPALEDFGQYLKKNPDVIKKVAIGIGVLIGVVIGLNVALWALSANPVTLIFVGIVAAVAAVIAILTVAYFKFDSVKRIIDAIIPVVQWLGEMFGKVLVSYFQLALWWIDKVAQALGTLWDVLAPIGAAIGRAFVDAFKAVGDGLRSAWNFIVRNVNPILNRLKSVPGLGWLPDRLPEWQDQGPQTRTTYQSGGVTRMATGGIVTSPTRALIGEAGPEAVIPLDRFNFGRATTTNVTINVQASPLSSPADVGAAVVDALKAYERRNGTLPLKVA